MVEKIKLVLAFLRLWPLLLLYKFSRNRHVVDADINRWNMELRPGSAVGWFSLCWLLSFQPSFRNLFYFRIRPLPRLVKKLLCPPDPYFFITDEIKGVFSDFEGGAIYTVHAFGTRIHARSVGAGCTFRQFTTLGAKSIDRPLEVPIVGRNVDFGASVGVFGRVTIGDNAVIGAGAIVVKDVPANAIVVGNPAKVIGYKKHKF